MKRRWLRWQQRPPRRRMHPSISAVQIDRGWEEIGGAPMYDVHTEGEGSRNTPTFVVKDYFPCRFSLSEGGTKLLRTSCMEAPWAGRWARQGACPASSARSTPTSWQQRQRAAERQNLLYPRANRLRRQQQQLLQQLMLAHVTPQNPEESQRKKRRRRRERAETRRRSQQPRPLSSLSLSLSLSVSVATDANFFPASAKAAAVPVEKSALALIDLRCCGGGDGCGSFTNAAVSAAAATALPLRRSTLMPSQRRREEGREGERETEN